MSQIALIGIALAFMLVVMTAAWLFQRAVGNAGWIDVFWTYGTGAMGVALALAPASGGSGPTGRQIAIACLIAAWSLRLGTFVALRVAKGTEDPRYRELRREWGDAFQRRAFWFIESQAFVSALLGVAMVAAARNPARGFGLLDLMGVFVLAIAILGEATADRQLQRFRQNPANRGGICDVGLWRYSRHPNYFFEWLGWWAYPLFALAPGAGYRWGWLAFIAPAIMGWILVKVTGIPPTEAAMLTSRGEAFRAYQRRTSAFIPLPPRTP